MVGRIITGIIIVAIGYFITTKSNWIMENFGRLAFFEQHLGSSGGTRLFYQLLGVVVVIGGFMIATGILQDLLRRFFAPYFGAL